MHFKFATKRLKELYTTEKGSNRYDPAIVDRFFKVMSIIDSARSVQDLYAMKSLQFEKLKGKRASQHSLRLNKQWRLIVSMEDTEEGMIILIHEIKDYH